MEKKSHEEYKKTVKPEILPDSMVGLAEMHEYGYSWDEMLPLTKDKAVELFKKDVPVYQLHEDNSEDMIEDMDALQKHEGLFGVEKDDWTSCLEYQSMKDELEASAASKEALLLYGSENQFGIYQLKDIPETRDIRFMNVDYLESKGISLTRKNYDLVYTAPLEEGTSLEDIYIRFNINHPEDFKGHSLSVSDVVVLHQNGENTSHYVDFIGYREVPEFTRELAQERVLEHTQDEPEQMAVSVEGRYISIQACEDGYDYSIYDDYYRLLDGGIYDNPDISIYAALNNILEDIGVAEQEERVPVDYEELMENVGEREVDRLIVLDFKSKTNEMFHDIDGQRPEDVEQTVLAYIKFKIDEYDMDVKIIDVVVSGSRCRGMEQEDSDLDVVIEYSGSIREDTFFNLLHEDGFEIGDVPVDINPITKGKTGTLGEYLTWIEDYLSEKMGIVRVKEIIDEIKTADKLIAYQEQYCAYLHLNKDEAQLLLGYLEWHGYTIGADGSMLYRGDLEHTKGEIIWEEYSLKEVALTASEWNYELLEEAEGMEQEYYNSLKKDEQMLDKLTNRIFNKEKLEEQSILESFRKKPENTTVNREEKKIQQSLTR